MCRLLLVSCVKEVSCVEGHDILHVSTIVAVGGSASVGHKQS